VVATVSAEARSQPSLTINDHAGKPFWSVSCDE
jgi:hypothetical protein